MNNIILLNEEIEFGESEVARISKMLRNAESKVRVHKAAKSRILNYLSDYKQSTLTIITEHNCHGLGIKIGDKLTKKTTSTSEYSTVIVQDIDDEDIRQPFKCGVAYGDSFWLYTNSKDYTLNIKR